MHPVPKKRSKLVRQRKITEALAMYASLLPAHLQPNCAQQFAIGGFGHLKFGDAFAEVIPREMHGFP